MLRYIGNGAWIPGIPARDLKAEEAEIYAKRYEFQGKHGVDGLLASGLYERMSDSKPAAKEKAGRTKEA